MHISISKISLNIHQTPFLLKQKHCFCVSLSFTYVPSPDGSLAFTARTLLGYSPLHFVEEWSGSSRVQLIRIVRFPSVCARAPCILPVPLQRTHASYFGLAPPHQTGWWWTDLLWTDGPDGGSLSGALNFTIAAPHPKHLPPHCTHAPTL